MAYGIIKIDTITFTDGGIDKSVAISGLVQNPTFTGNVTVTGTISGNTVRGQTVSGVTVTGATAQFTSGTFVSLTGTTLQGATATYTTGSFTSLTGTTTSGTTANFVSGVFSTQISGVTVTGTTANFTSGNFTNISGGTHTITSGVFALGTAANPSISFVSDPNSGLYSPGEDQVAISTNGTGRLFVGSTGNVGVGTASPGGKLVISDGSTAFQFDPVGGTGNILRSLTSGGSRDALLFDASQYVYTNGATEYARIDTSGRLGLGTSSPGFPIEVKQTGVDSTIWGYNVAQFADATANNTGLRVATNTSTSGLTQLVAATSSAASQFGFWTYNGSAWGERVRIDSSGRVGIGTTSPSRPLHVSSSGSEQVILSSTSGSLAGIFFEPNGTTYTPFFGATGNSLVSYTQGLERARIDSSGRLLVGTSTSRAVSGVNSNIQLEGTTYDSSCLSLVRNSASAALDAGGLLFGRSRGSGTTVVTNNDRLGFIGFFGANGSDLSNPAALIEGFSDGTSGVGDMPGRLVFSTTADGASSPTERMRISGGGVVMINSTTDFGAGVFQVNDASGRWAMTTSCTNPDGGGIYYHWNIKSGNTNVGSVTSTTTTTTFATSSDYRLKENVILLTGAIDRINQLPVHRFNFIADPDKTVDGFLAHEVQAVVPECVIGAKDAVDVDGNPVYQGIDQSKLVPLLTAALQEALQKIEDLEGRLTAAGI